MIASNAWWDAFDRKHPAPTFFARPAFARALCEGFPHLEPSPILVERKSRQFLIPAVRSHKRLGFRHAVAFPLGAYSCILGEDGRTAQPECCSDVLHEAAHGFDTFSFVGWPLAAQPSIEGASQRMYRTAVIDCSNGFDDALRGMRGVTRRMAWQSVRRGVRCRRSETDAASLSRYYRMLREASERFGLREPTISRTLLDAVVRHGGEDVELWFAELDGEALAGGLVLVGRDELFFWSAAMRREFSRYRPSNALNVALLERACERGVRWYNLGASEGLDGVARFKRDLGAREVAYASLTMYSRAYRVYAGVRDAFRAEAAS